MPCPAVRPFWSIQSNHILDRRGCTTYALCTGEFEKELEQAIGLLLDLCKAHLMMTPSLSRCKTELMMLSFNGKGSRAYRIKYYEPHSLGFFPVLCEPDVKQLLLVKSSSPRRPMSRSPTEDCKCACSIQSAQNDPNDPCWSQKWSGWWFGTWLLFS